MCNNTVTIPTEFILQSWTLSFISATSEAIL